MERQSTRFSFDKTALPIIGRAHVREIRILATDIRRESQA
jgi:hypothetical protein